MLSYERYKHLTALTLLQLQVDVREETSPYLPVWLIALHGVGFFGILLYVLELGRYFGGVENYIVALLSTPYEIRGDEFVPTSVGTQLAYLGWFASGWTIYELRRKNLSSVWMTLPLFQVLGNLVYINRTRPVWIIFTSILIWLVYQRNISLRYCLKYIVIFAISAMGLFMGIGMWVGKIFEGKYELGGGLLSDIAVEIYIYGISGFAYFDYLLKHNQIIDYFPSKSFYPVLKLLSKVGLASEPPSQILGFHPVPFMTNVGTFLEPFYADGGILYVIVGVLTYSYLFDIIGYVFLRTGRPAEIYAWSNICFCVFMSFFTAKIFSFAFWMFITIGFFSFLPKMQFFEKKKDRMLKNSEKG